jgi:hypothetical protein
MEWSGHEATMLCFLHAKSELGKGQNHEIDVKNTMSNDELADINKLGETRETFCSC